MEVALFSVKDFFRSESGSSSSDDNIDAATGINADRDDNFSERIHQFPGMELKVREFAFHSHNANLLWPGSISFARWLAEQPWLIRGRHVLELGSGTGALAIFLHRAMGCQITTSDMDDEEIAMNIAHNCRANGIPPLPHVPHTWGEPFAAQHSPPPWDLILASDILLYVKQYPNLVKTISFLLSNWRFISNRQNDTIEIKSDAACLSEESSSSSTAHQEDLAMASNLEFSRLRDSGPGRRLTNRSHIPLSLPHPCFIMSWQRRLSDKSERFFFALCEKEGMKWEDIGRRVFLVYLQNNS
eukprot:TRINITY_DN5120_c0_g1_i2.p1 TRINITY_DN5120_c0_g1~~TRINITY_DN5120_c0_g1_i2.p1  ORF type:complete len:300 (+),score=54.58 TRINITY_DN5120_c0_g1_i2:330-1229(+)